MVDKQQGYYRFPTVHNDQVVFVSESDLWEVPTQGGRAVRLTTQLGGVGFPHFSPDGKWIAFLSNDEGAPEIYRMPSAGGLAERLTFMGSMCHVVGWDKKNIIFASTATQAFLGIFELYSINPETHEISKLPYGQAMHVAYGKKGVLIGRNTGDSARWKRYKGGRNGRLWVDLDGTGKFTQLDMLEGNIASPMWIDDRIYFISDNNGIGNLYSSMPDGSDLKQLTDHKEFYARNATTDGKSIVYQHGADLHHFDLKNSKSTIIEIQYSTPKSQAQRKFVPTGRYLEHYSINSDGSSLGVISRGKAFTFGDWEGPVNQVGERQGVRYRLITWLPDGEQVILVSDEGGEDHLEIHTVKGEKILKVFSKIDIGRPTWLEVSPKGGYVCVVNHRHELLVVDLKKSTSKVIDQSKFAPIHGFNWSPDGAWIAYATTINPRQVTLRIYNLKSGKIEDLTDPILVDSSPVFDPQGRFVYFLSSRIFNPVYDNMHFDYNFPRGERPYLITLKNDQKSPFIPEVKGFGMNQNGENSGKESEDKKDAGEDAKADADVAVEIDFDGIKNRVIPFPVAEGLYGSMEATKERVFYTVYQVEGTLGRDPFNQTPEAKAVLKVYDFNKLEEIVFEEGISNFTISSNEAALVYRKGEQLRVVDAARDTSQKLPTDLKTIRKNGWINLARLKVAIDPVAEWRQMYAEAWRLQRDYYWVENMSEIDWKRIYNRYLPLVDRVGARAEFSDLMWEMQGELGTSHAYELGGDYRPHPNYQIGFLGAEFEFDNRAKFWKISRIANGDTWDGASPPPLKQPGINVAVGTQLISVNGEKLTLDNHPYKALMNIVGEEVRLEVKGKSDKKSREITVKTIGGETSHWYRDWVESNREYVHKNTKGKVGYIHIPNMGPVGYAEFHRYFLAELDYEGLIVDVRQNGGGHVSPLLLEKLARRRFGYYQTRWMGQQPKPPESPRGPMVALTNEAAGSDGDIFSHGFKMLKLGKLIGTRTWGGVIGIWPRNSLVDGTVTTQPEFSNWFFDVGYGVENYGTDPDITVEIKPQDYANGKDPQLDRGIKEVLAEIKNNPHEVPDLTKNRPSLKLP